MSVGPVRDDWDPNFVTHQERSNWISWLARLLLNPHPCGLGVALRGRFYRVSCHLTRIIISKQWHEFQLALGVGFIRGVGARSISSFIGQFGPTHSLPCLAATEIRVLQLEDSPEKSVEDAKKGYSIRTTKYTG